MDGTRTRLIRSAPVPAVVLVAALWGVTFTLTAHTLAALPASEVVALRFGAAAILVWLLARRRPPLPPPLRARGTALGLLLGLGFLLQTHGLLTTDAMTSGLLTGLVVVGAPVLERVIFRRRLGPQVWVAVVLATLGLLLITARGTGVGPGALMTVGGAVVWALHLVLTSRWSEPEHALALAHQQTLAVAALALVVTVWEDPRPAVGWSDVPLGTWLLVGLIALACTAVPMVLLTWAQARLDATTTAVILTAEPAVAALTAVVGGVPVHGRTALGGVLVVGAMLLIQARRPRPGAVADDDVRPRCHHGPSARESSALDAGGAPCVCAP